MANVVPQLSDPQSSAITASGATISCDVTFSLYEITTTGASESFSFPATGTVDVTVDWGDGSAVQTFTSTPISHTYASAGTYDVRVSGSVGDFQIYGTSSVSQFAGAVVWAGLSISSTSLGSTIRNSSVTTFDGQLLDTSSVTDFIAFAQSCTSLTAVYAGTWDTSSVTSFSGFVLYCSSLVTLDASGWDTSLVTNFSYFANGCSSLTALDVSGWNTSSVTTFDSFANGCSSLTALDVSGWDVSSVTTFNSFLRSCSSLTALDVSGWVPSVATNFSGFVRSCSGLTSLDISGWDTSSATSFSVFAYLCSNLTTLTVGNAFDNTPCTDFSSAFANCALNQASVDAILVSIDNAGTSNGTLGISGGTNSAPSATGNTAKSNLQGRGWTVNTN